MGNNEVTPLWQIQADVNKTFLKWKRLAYHLKTEEAEYAYRVASKPQRAALMILINAGDLKGVQSWIVARKQDSLQYWSYRKLRARGKELSIPRWSRLDRDELIQKIKDRENDARGTQTDCNAAS